MNFDRKNLKTIMFLIVFTIFILVAFQNIATIIEWLMTFLSMITPFILGGALAFIINIPMNFFEKKIFKNKKTINNKICQKISRPASLLLAFVVIIAVVTAIFNIVVPKLTETIGQVTFTAQRSIPKLMVYANKYVDDEQINNIIKNVEQIDVKQIITMVINFFKSDTSTTIFNSTVGFARGVVNSVVNIAIGFVFALYILLQKETLSVQVKKGLRAILKDSWYNKIIKVSTLSYRTFANFITGQCLEATILGTMFVISMTIFRLPYALLVGVLIGFSALIPFIGAFLGFCLSALLIVMVNPMQVVYFLILFLVIQQIEGNLIYPHVVGGSVGLPSIWVLVALSLGGSLFGFVGILIFIPLSSVVYSLFCEWANKRLEQKRLIAIQQNDSNV